MSRPPIPEELKRAVLVEAGHRCAIPRCGQTELDIHHIIPWETRKKHEYQNLIALCPVCHRRAHQGDIDRKALRLYKEKLLAEFGKGSFEEFSAEIIEIKRRILKECAKTPGFSFSFDFPEFKDPAERIVSKNLETLGNEWLIRLQQDQENYNLTHQGWTPPPSMLRGDYRIVRRDSQVISIKYSVFLYSSGAAHGSHHTHVQNFTLKPFQPITLTELLIDDEDALNTLSSIVRRHLLSRENIDREWVITGTKPKESNFRLFNILGHGVNFTFSEYQIDCYAAGEQELVIRYDEMKEIMNASVYQAVVMDNF